MGQWDGDRACPGHPPVAAGASPTMALVLLVPGRFRCCFATTISIACTNVRVEKLATVR